MHFTRLKLTTKCCLKVRNEGLNNYMISYIGVMMLKNKKNKPEKIWFYTNFASKFLFQDLKGLYRVQSLDGRLHEITLKVPLSFLSIV